MRICPSARWLAQPARALGTAAWSGSRFSPTGVPTTTITCSPVLTMAGSADASSRPAATTRSSSAAAPGSAKGIVAEFTRATDGSLTSKIPTLRPREAKAMASGRPTCPHPPITTTSRSKPREWDDSATGSPPVVREFGRSLAGSKWDSPTGKPERILATASYMTGQNYTADQQYRPGDRGTDAIAVLVSGNNINDPLANDDQPSHSRMRCVTSVVGVAGNDCGNLVLVRIRGDRDREPGFSVDLNRNVYRTLRREFGVRHREGGVGERLGVAQPLPQFLRDVRCQRRHHEHQRLGDGAGQRPVRRGGLRGVRGQLHQPGDGRVTPQLIEIPAYHHDRLVQEAQRAEVWDLVADAYRTGFFVDHAAP